MKYTPEQRQQNIDAFVALMDGKPVEYLHPSRGWTETDGVNNQWLHRPKTEPKTRLWRRAEDVPLSPCYIRGNTSDGLSWALIVSAGTGGVNAAGDGGVHFISYEDLEMFLHSTDRKTWHPCTVTE